MYGIKGNCIERFKSIYRESSMPIESLKAFKTFWINYLRAILTANWSNYRMDELLERKSPDILLAPSEHNGV
jgi:hypothetical protein